MPNNNNNENNNNNSSGGGMGPGMLGMLQGAFNMLGAGQQHRRQKELMDIQFGNQQELNRQGHQLQMDMWNKTNYGAQIEHMKKAGLNPALMYGMSGGGGTTAGSQGGGSAASGSAVQMHPMDMANLSLVDAQRKKLEAEAGEINSRRDLNEINRILNEHDYKWLKKNDLSRHSIGVVKGIADATGESFQGVLDAIDDRVSDILKVYKDPAKAVKEKTEAIKKAVKESAKAHGVLYDNITEGIKKGFKNWRKDND